MRRRRRRRMGLATGQIAILKALLVAGDKPVDESKGKST